MDKLILNSYAKLNLYLKVLNKRKDNYHNIKTVFERITLCDKIILKPRRDKEIKIISSASNIPKDNCNLAYRSARLLQDSFDTDRGVDIEIIKRIPVGGGMGGGSSNAASVLMGLNKLWRLNLTRNKLISLAGRIGSDVPFFIYNTPFAVGGARGDRIRILKNLKGVRFWHILVVPKINVPTPKIYKRWDMYFGLTPHFGINSKVKRPGLTRSKDDVKLFCSALKKRDTVLMGKFLFNSLEEVTAKLYPQVVRIKERLKVLGLKLILMSGSGPAIFGIVYSRKEAISLCRQLKEENKSWQVFATRTI